LTAEPTAAAHRLGLREVFFALALLYVLPFWVVHHVPTVDGPCHTYNAWVLRQFSNVERYPLFQQFYEINLKPYPNWISHGTMALLMVAVPPPMAEKLLVSGYVLAFLFGAWYLAGAVRQGERWLAFLAFPFAYHQLFQYGFYNFSISVAFFLIILGYWWRHRERPGPAFAVTVNLLLWLCYFSHILSFGLALVAIAVLWLATLRRETWKRHLRHVPILLPQLALPLWFFARQGGGEVPAAWPLAQLVKYFVRLEALFALGEAQLWVGTALAVVFLVLFVLSCRRGRGEENAFLILALLFAALYFLSPDGLAGGWLLKNRLSLYPFLLLIPWLSPRLGLRFGSRVEMGGAAVLVLSALLNLGYLIHGYRALGATVDGYLAGLAPLHPNSRVLALTFERVGPTDVISHAIAYAALEKGGIDWDNYESKVPFFPVRFRDDIDYPDIPGVLWDPGSYRVRPNRDLVDALYLWKMPPENPLGARLRRNYTVTWDAAGGLLFERGIERQPAAP
jgi:hypothetical protein